MFLVVLLVTFANVIFCAYKAEIHEYVYSRNLEVLVKIATTKWHPISAKYIMF